MTLSDLERRGQNLLVYLHNLRCMCKLFSFIVYYRVLLLFLFMACQWYCPLPDI